MEKLKTSRIYLSSPMKSVRSFTLSRLRSVNNMAGSMKIVSKSSSIPQALNDDIARNKQSPTVACADHEHPLFVSEGEDHQDLLFDDVTKPTGALQPEAQAGESVPAVTTGLNNKTEAENREYRLAPEDERKHQDNPLSNSLPGFDADGHRVDFCLDGDELSTSFPSHSAAPGSSVSSSELEASFDEFDNSSDMSHILKNKSVKLPNGESEIQAAITSNHAVGKHCVAPELSVGNDVGVRVPQKTDGQKNRVLSPPSESGKKPKTKTENSANSLVFTYKKDAEEVEIFEQPNMDSHSGSDLEGEPADRGAEFQNGSTELANAANSNVPVRKKNSGSSEDLKKPAKKKKSSFGFVLNPNYKFRHDEFKRIFRNIPRSDRLIVDYSCALQRNILVQGRLYISQNWICFYACIFGVETAVSIPFKDITHISKEKTALVFPNAILISTKDEKHFFSSLNARDKTYLTISSFWKNANSQQGMSQEEMWSWIHYSYGDDLGVSVEDQDYVPLPPEEKAKHMAKIELEATIYQDLEGFGTSAHSKDAAGDDDTLTAESEGICNKPLTKSSNSDLLASEPCDSSGEVHCSGHEHFPILVSDEVLNLSIDRLFDLCFSDSHVFRRFTEIKKTTDVVVSEWPKSAAADGKSIRNLSYTLSLNLAMTSKKAPATEKQVMYPSSKPGCIYTIDTECHTPTIPYGDSFYIVNRYCLTRVSEAKSRLRITSQIVYLKNVFFKSFIEKNATSGILETFKVLVNLLQNEAEGKDNGNKDLLTSNPAALTTEQSVSKVDMVSGIGTQFWKYCVKNPGSSKQLLLLALLLTVVMMIVIKFFIFSDGSEMNVCISDQKATYQELIHQLQMQINQQQVEIERWKQEHSRMMHTIDELRDKVADLMQQRHLAVN